MATSSSILAALLGVAFLATSASADGWHFRVGVGPGYGVGSHAVDDASENGGGLSINSELAIGKELRPGLVIGGGTFPMIVPKPSYGDQDAGGHHLSATGAFVDRYFTPKRGLHIQAALLFTAGYHEAQAGHDSAVGFGFGAMLGVGYEVGLSGKWRFGPLVRATYYHWSGGDYTIDLASPALLVTFTRS